MVKAYVMYLAVAFSIGMVTYIANLAVQVYVEDKNVDMSERQYCVVLQIYSDHVIDKAVHILNIQDAIIVAQKKLIDRLSRGPCIEQNPLRVGQLEDQSPIHRSQKSDPRLNSAIQQEAGASRP